jgi:hypothetical protein
MDVSMSKIEETAMNQRSQPRANPVKFNPTATPSKQSEKLFSFIFNTLALLKTTDHAMQLVDNTLLMPLITQRS